MSTGSGMTRSQPTYEGLKPEGVREWAEDKRGSQPTYEGLKRAWLAKRILGAPVPSLPMRD